MSIEQWFEKATAYFSGAMTVEEIKRFETETAASEELSQLMQLWKTTDAEAEIYERYKEDAAKLIATHQKLKPDFVDEQTAHEFSTAQIENVKPVRKIKLPVWQWAAVAAIITGIIVSIGLLIPSTEQEAPVVQNTIPKNEVDTIQEDAANVPGNKNTENDVKPTKQNQGATLYAQAFTPDKIPEDPNGPLDDAFFYYASAEYENAITAIDGARDKPATRGSKAFTPLTEFYASYYKALSLMSIGNTAAAIPLLQKALQQSPAEILSIKAQWYLSLAYLKEEKISSALETLKLLINNPGAGGYKGKAEKILAGIDK